MSDLTPNWTRLAQNRPKLDNFCLNIFIKSISFLCGANLAKYDMPAFNSPRLCIKFAQIGNTFNYITPNNEEYSDNIFSTFGVGDPNDLLTIPTVIRHHLGPNW